MAQPVISYPGAKWRFWKYLKQYIPTDIKHWREPFLGGGSMSLSIADDPDYNLETMIAGDLAPEIWAFWTGCRNHADDVMEIARKWFIEKCPNQQILKGIPSESPDYAKQYEVVIEEARKFWAWSQEVDCSTLSIPERAARIFLVNKVSFSGMGDSGSLSKERFCEFNLESLMRIKMAQPLLQKMEIRNCSFEETMANTPEKDGFIFLDPPYYRQESSGLYGRNGDTHKGFPHQGFAEFTKAQKCKWLITYDDSIYVRKMFLGDGIYINPFKIDGGYLMAMRPSEDALDGEELLITNYDIYNDECSGLDLL